MAVTLAKGYSSKSSQLELSNEYQHDRVKTFFQNYLHPDEFSINPVGRYLISISPLYIFEKCSGPKYISKIPYSSE